MVQFKRHSSSKIKKSNRRRKNNQKTSLSSFYRKTKEAIKKSKKEPLNKFDLISCVNSIPHFLGVFASDELFKLSILKSPAFLIVNLDVSSQKGSHWIALRIGIRSIEIFDSLGFDPKFWNSYPSHLFRFLSGYSFTHKLIFSPILQPANTFTCGLYSIYYLRLRLKFDFNYCVRQFSSDLSVNNLKLYTLLLKK
jgi:hypothetical protein